VHVALKNFIIQVEGIRGLKSLQRVHAIDEIKAQVKKR
jgi:hypothetical protein